jgi:glycosyltransferase involved in cell wall biosynthesis
LPSLSIVIPCYNEFDAIPRVLSALERAKQGLVEAGTISDCQVLVVNDGSSDGTARLLQEYPWVQTMHLPFRLGYGAALKTGFLNSTGDWITFLDLDGTYDPEDLGLLLRDFREEEFVLGERLSAGKGMPWTRKAGNIFFTWLVRLLFRQSVRDVCTGCRVFSRKWLPEITSLPTDDLDYALSMTLWALKNGVTIRELPIRYHLRTGESKLSVVADGNRFLWTILRARYAYAKSSDTSRQTF